MPGTITREATDFARGLRHKIRDLLCYLPCFVLDLDEWAIMAEGSAPDRSAETMHSLLLLSRLLEESTDARIAEQSRRLRAFADFTSMLRQAIEEVRSSNSAELHFQWRDVLQGLNIIRRLLPGLKNLDTQFGMLEPVVAALRNLHEECPPSRPQPATSRELADRIQASIVEHARTISPSVVRLRFHIEDGDCPVLFWLDDDGRVAGRNALDALLTKMIDWYQAALKDLEKGSEPPPSPDRVRAALSPLDPQLFAAVDHALSQPRWTRLFIASGESETGLPLGVFFLIRSACPSKEPCVVISVERRHYEFILQNAEGKCYYFPPCLVAARIVVQAGRCGFSNPLIIQPAGSYRWCHPYTGDLSERSERVTPLSGTDRELSLMAQPSPAAAELFKSELADRAKKARERDMCLVNQSVEMRTFSDALCRALADPHGNPLDVIHAVHQFAHVGLTRAHQNNTDTPRAWLNDEDMVYCFRDKPIPEALRHRFYPYRP